MVANTGAVVKPMPQANVHYKQSRYDLPKLPMRTMVVGRSAAGKGTLIASIIREQYAGCFEAIYVFASTVEVDPLWIELVKYIAETLGQPGSPRSSGGVGPFRPIQV